jgi:acyl-homoserine-lactone acylase
MIYRNPYITLKIITGFILLLLFVRCDIQPQKAKTEILWDNFGVPHIYGKNLKEMYYGFGWAQMENHANLILQLYAEARGRASEYWGESHFESDKKIWQFNIPDRSQINYQQQDPVFKSYLDAFVNGMNDYAQAYPESIGSKVKQVLPVNGVDVMAHILRVLCLEFIAGEDLFYINRASNMGSNAYAIAPSKSASGNAMLLTNPHLPWTGLFTFFEAHLISKDYNAYGVSLVGVPTLAMAFNPHLGWAMTVNTLDGSDRYKLVLQKNGYLLDGNLTTFEKKTHLFNVSQNDGTQKEISVTFEYSQHGPIISKNDTMAYALRFVGMENARIFEQFHKMAGSSNLPAFESALRMLQIPMFNIIYADQSGNILYLFNGNIPERPEGDFKFWKGTIDGTVSKYIWHKYHDYEDLPKVINPSSGFLQNCNDPPWTCTYPPVLNPADFPVYLAPRFMHLRAQRATNMILNNLSISFDQLKGYKLNTGLEAADRFIDDLLYAVEKYPDTTTLHAANILKNWDRKTDSDSRGAVLFTHWFDQLDGSLFEKQWDPSYPISTPDGISDQKKAVELLIGAANEIKEKYGSMDIAWGDVHRFRMNELDYPANGGPERYGIFRTIDYLEDTDHKKRAGFGDTYTAITEFGKKVRAQVFLSYGNASQPGNKHIGDQLKLLSEKKLRPAFLEKDEILKNLEKRERFDM